MSKTGGRCLHHHGCSSTEPQAARVDVIGYACLVAIMSMGRGYHRTSEAKLLRQTIDNDAPSPVVTSAGALIDGIKTLGAKRVSILTPYMKPLTALVVDYLEDAGIQVVDSISLEIPDNLKVGLLDPRAPIEITRNLNLKGVDAVVASACVQMPSLASIQPIEDRIGLPVLSSSVATAFAMLKRLGLETSVPGFGSLLSGQY